MSVLRATWAILRKDLQLERRSAEVLPGMVLLALGSMVLLRFALDQTSVEGDLAAGALLIPLLLAALLGTTRLFATEEAGDGIQQLLLSPAPPGAMLLAKVAGLWILLVLLEIVLLPAFALLLLGTSLAPGLPGVILLLLLLDAALAVIGGLVAAIAIGTRARELVVPILLVPLGVPALIAAQAGLASLLTRAPEPLVWRWPAVLAIYTLVIGLIGSVLAEYLVED